MQKICKKSDKCAYSLISVSMCVSIFLFLWRVRVS
jgi:hypothetical protein